MEVITKTLDELIDIPPNHFVFDIETTGLNKDTDYIIELGALKYRNNELVEEFSYLINPGIKLPEVITSITGITDEDLKDKSNISLVLPKFIDFIEDSLQPFEFEFIINTLNEEL